MTALPNAREMQAAVRAQLPQDVQDILSVQRAVKSGRIVDDIIELRRQNVTPTLQALIDKRRVTRLTMGQINQLSEDGIAAGLNPQEIGDSRSPAVRFLDLIDLPRNTTANIAFGQSPGVGEIAGSAAVTGVLGGALGALVGVLGGPGGVVAGAVAGAKIGAGVSLGADAIAAAARPYVLDERERQKIIAGANAGTLGQPSIYFSDALATMGVENKVARAVIGFTGDVLMDPTTYLAGGGNTVKWAARGGEAIVVDKAASKLVDDIARHVATTGALPNDPAYQPFMAMWRDSIKVGDELIDVSGSGATLRDQLLGAAKKLNGSNLPTDTLRQQRQRIADLLREDILTSARLNKAGVPTEMVARGEAARDLLRRYSTASELQWSFPLAGFVSNRLRTITGGKTIGQANVGRIGRQGRVYSKLGMTEDAFAARVARETGEKVDRLAAERKNIFGDAYLRIDSKRIPQLTGDLASAATEVDGEIRVPVLALSSADRLGLEAKGFTYAGMPRGRLDRLDAIDNAMRELDVSNRTRHQHEATLALDKARQAKERAEQGVASAEQAVGRSEALAAEGLIDARNELERAAAAYTVAEATAKRLSGPAMTDVLNPYDDMMAVLRQGDAATAISGPAAVARGIRDRWTNKALSRAEEGRAAALAESDALDRSLRVNRQRAAGKLRRMDPDATGLNTSENLAKKLSSIEAAEAAAVGTRKAINEARAAVVPIPLPPKPAIVANALKQDTTAFKYRIGRGAGEGASNAGKANHVDIKFASDLDRLLWWATEKTVGGNVALRVARKEAIEWLERAFGRSALSLRKRGREMRDQVKTWIEKGRPGVTAGASAGAEEGGRAFEFAASKAAVRREQMIARLYTKKGNLRSRNVGLIRDIPRDVQRRQQFLDKVTEIANRQKQSVLRQIDQVQAIGDDLKKSETMLEQSKIAADRVVDAKNAEIEALKDTTLHRLVQKAIDAENAVRNIFGIGRKNIREIAQLRRAQEHLSEFRREQIVGSYMADLRKLQDQYPHATPDDINNAWQIMAADIFAKSGEGRRGFPVARDGTQLDAILLVKAAMEADEGKRMLLDPQGPMAALAQKYIRQMDEIRDAEVAAGILPAGSYDIPYFHGSLTQKARKVAGDLANRLGLRNPRGEKMRLSDALPSSMRKVSNRMFYGKNGREYVYVGELANREPWRAGQNLADVHPFEAWRQGELLRDPSKMKIGDLWDHSNGAKGLQDGERWMPEVFPTSALQLNIDKERFMKWVGQEVAGPLFEEDMVLRLSSRTLQHEHAMTFNRFKNEVLSIVQPLDPETARLLARGSGTGKVTMNGVEYRPLKGNLDSPDLRFPLDDTTKQGYFPVAFADALEDYAAKFQPAGTVENLIRHAIDPITALWKKFTLIHPSWMITNIIGGTYNAWAVAGVNPAELTHHAGMVANVVRKVHGLGDATLTAAEKQLAEHLVEIGALSAGRTQMEVLNAARMTRNPTIELAKRETRGSAFRKGSWRFNWWFRANAATDDLFRAATYSALRARGMGEVSAQELMLKALFDYGDLSKWEQTVGTRVWPFFRWMRNNVALQAKLFIEKPQIAAAFPKIKNALEDHFEAEQRVPEEMRPRWMRDNIAVQISNRPEAKFALLSLFTPIQELIEMGQVTGGQEGLVDFIKYGTSSVSPVFKAPFEITAGKEMFTGREIGDPDQGKVSMWQYLAEQLRPYRDISRSASMVSDGAGPGTVARRFLLGGRVQNTTDDKLANTLEWDVGETTTRLRRALKQAAKAGDVGEQQRIAVRITEKYRMLFNAGLYESVPKELRRRFAAEHLRVKE